MRFKAVTLLTALALLSTGASANACREYDPDNNALTTRSLPWDGRFVACIGGILGGMAGMGSAVAVLDKTPLLPEVKNSRDMGERVVLIIAVLAAGISTGALAGACIGSSLAASYNRCLLHASPADCAQIPAVSATLEASMGGLPGDTQIASASV